MVMKPAAVSMGDMLFSLEAKARAANTLAELGFSIANDAFPVIPFRQVLIFTAKQKLFTVSGLATPADDSPYLVWLKRSWPHLLQCFGDNAGWHTQDSDVFSLQSRQLLDGWAEWWPLGLYAVPIRRRSGELLAWVVFLLEQQPQPGQLKFITRLTDTWSYCWEMLQGKTKQSLSTRWQALSKTKRSALVLVLLSLQFLPIRQAALAPAEIISLDTITVNSPLDGVIKTVHVRPNQRVVADELLFSLDDTTLRNRLEVLQQSVAVAQAELITATHKAFENDQSKAELTVLTGRLNERRAELASVQAQLDRVNVNASQAGVVLFSSSDDWLNRPVATGERIMQIADQQKPGVLIYLAVADAIKLEQGTNIRLFLTVKPLSPMSAVITESSYQVTLSPDGVPSYRIRAKFIDVDEDSQARIGLRGTAKIYGDRVFLIYYLLRRPLATIREWTGL